MPPSVIRWGLAASVVALSACASDGDGLIGKDARPFADAAPAIFDDAAGLADAAGFADAAVFEDAAVFADAAPAQEDASVMRRTVHAYGALGSSSTAGQGASAPDRAYVPLLHARLAPYATNGAVTLLNRGSGGARIDSFLAALPELERERPELVTILPLTDFVQTNEMQFRAGYDELLRRLQAAGVTVFFGDLRIDPAYLCQGGMSGPGGCYGEQDRALLGGKNVIVAELAARYPSVIVVPVYDQNAAHPEWNAMDGHPNDRGHQYLADTFWAAIAPWLGGP